MKHNFADCQDWAGRAGTLTSPWSEGLSSYKLLPFPLIAFLGVLLCWQRDRDQRVKAHVPEHVLCLTTNSTAGGGVYLHPLYLVSKLHGKLAKAGKKSKNKNQCQETSTLGCTMKQKVSMRTSSCLPLPADCPASGPGEAAEARRSSGS